jgi:hypothetical protein
MPGAIILADQDLGAGPGSPGVARNDLWLSQIIDLTCTTIGNSSFSWSLLDKPVGSTVTLATPTLATSSFTPDVAGTYRVRLVTNGGGVGNEQTLVYRVRYSNTGVLVNRGWAYPAFGEVDTEANYNSNVRGWAEDLEYILEDTRTSLTQDVPTDTLVGRSSAGTGDPEFITCTSAGRALLDDASASDQRTTLGLGALATLSTVGTTEITNSSVTNAKLASVSTATFKGRVTAGTGPVEDLTSAQATSLLADFIGDSGAGGTKGLVPAPSIGDAAKFLAGSGLWTTIATPTTAAPTIGIGAGNTEGVASTFARSDHDHKLRTGSTDLDIGAVADGGVVHRSGTSLVSQTVTNANLATVTTQTFKGRTTAGTGAPEDLTATQATTILNTFTSGSNNPGLKGLVPSPTSADTAKFLRGDGTWATAGGGSNPVFVHSTRAIGSGYNATWLADDRDLVPVEANCWYFFFFTCHMQGGGSITYTPAVFLSNVSFMKAIGGHSQGSSLGGQVAVGEHVQNVASTNDLFSNLTLTSGSRELAVTRQGLVQFNGGGGSTTSVFGNTTLNAYTVSISLILFRVGTGNFSSGVS